MCSFTEDKDRLTDRTELLEVGFVISSQDYSSCDIEMFTVYLKHNTLVDEDQALLSNLKHDLTKL